MNMCMSASTGSAQGPPWHRLRQRRFHRISDSKAVRGAHRRQVQHGSPHRQALQIDEVVVWVGLRVQQGGVLERPLRWVQRHVSQE